MSGSNEEGAVIQRPHPATHQSAEEVSSVELL